MYPHANSSSSTINFVSRYCLEIFCYSFFSLEVFFGIIAMGAFFEPGSYLKDPWRASYTIILGISWMTYVPDNPLHELFMVIRILGPIRILNLYEPLKKTLNSFLKALTAVYKIWMAIFALMFFYALVGMYFFYGLEENRCRTSEHPHENSNHWEIVEESFSFCGNWNCEEGYLIFCLFSSSYITKINKYCYCN